MSITKDFQASFKLLTNSSYFLKTSTVFCKSVELSKKFLLASLNFSICTERFEILGAISFPKIFPATLILSCSSFILESPTKTFCNIESELSSSVISNFLALAISANSKFVLVLNQINNSFNVLSAPEI